ncbi:MAG TPA: N-6 DNA methylase [Solirubrobacterales bacterium]
MSRASGQGQLTATPVENGGLFSEHFLEHRLPEWPEYSDLDCRELMEEIGATWLREREGLSEANEAQVEEHLVQPVLNLLGHAWTPQAGYASATGRGVPDYALFLTDEARMKAAKLPKNSLDRFGDAVAIVEAKEFERPFNTRRGGLQNEDPHAQILRYLNETRVGWGILTNGAVWRLYSYESATQGRYYGVDLGELLEQRDLREFRRFAAFFAHSAFVPDEDGRCLLDRMLAEAERNTVSVGDRLERQVFEAVPLLAAGLLGEEERSEASLAAAFENSLVLLYRLLFCLHAEARDLLPVDNPHYKPQSLLHLRREIAGNRDGGAAHSEHSDRLYSVLRALFRIVDRGEPVFGVNAYNGGLFSPAQHTYFEGRSIPDPLLAPAVDFLSRIDGQFVDYRALSVRHLGTIYEKLLAYRLAEEGGSIRLEPSRLKHRSGAYFTPERVVDAIVARTLEPVLLRVSDEVSVAGLSGRSALNRFLKVRICDPAAGSGHFLVSAVEHMAQFIATDPSFAGTEGAYLPDLPELRRLVAERCIYGVDINPMAVELARLSLWLTTVDREQPLTILENLRVGNSIVGTSVKDLLDGGDTVFSSSVARSAEELIRQREVAVATSHSTSSEDVEDKKRASKAAEALREPLEEFADQTLGVALGDPEIGDPLHWEVEFPEVFLTRAGEPLAGGGFDAIVGNPPYVQIQSLGRGTADYCRERYRVAAGSFDVYVVFVERALELLAPTGRLGFIVPNKFTKLKMAEGLRELLVETGVAEEILDFGGLQLFGATNYTAILLLDASGGRTELAYRKALRSRGDPIAEIETREPASFELAALGHDPWVLGAPEERRILTAAQQDAKPLVEATAGIFTGLQTSADAVYIVEEEARAGGLVRVRSKASDGPVELEPDLLHPLASGGDVHPYAFAPTRQLLLFPYLRAATGEMELIPWARIESFPRVAAYLREHEARLRGREGGKMDTERWYAFGRTQNLGLHDRPKLGVPRLCDRLRASADPAGSVYLDNVDVNGLLAHEDGPSVWTLAVLLNSRLFDFLFRLYTVPFRGNYMSANRQFIAQLPVKELAAGEREAFDRLGRGLHETAAGMGAERRRFHDWLGGRLGARPDSLPGKSKLLAYDRHSADEVVRQLTRSAKRLDAAVGSRAFRAELVQEHAASVAKLVALSQDLERGAAEADQLVYDVYAISQADRKLVEGSEP